MDPTPAGPTDVAPAAKQARGSGRGGGECSAEPGDGLPPRPGRRAYRTGKGWQQMPGGTQK
jgi:hypothetical protein